MAADEFAPEQRATRRRLAAVAFLDIVGYSTLMAVDEAGMLARWMRALGEVIRPLLADHYGTQVKSTGDGILAEFASALDAVKWGLAVQQRIAGAPPAGTDEPTVAVRISVHLGDVVPEEGDIHGDGVNVAARLQEFAEPGGVVISEAVHDLVRGHLHGRARDLGLLQLKGLEEPVRAYAIGGQPASRAVSPRAGDGVPSIAVMPMRNLGSGGADDYFSEGIVEDIVVSLAALRDLKVIARSSTVVLGRQTADVRELGRMLGVRYVLIGSVRRSASRVRLSVQLCDAASGASLWAETMDEPLADLFDVQDRIVQRVVAGIAPHVRAAELRRALRKHPGSFTAYDYMLRAIDILGRLEANSFQLARELLDRAIAEDANFAVPYAWAAHWCGLNIGQGWSRSPDQDAAEASRFATRAIELDSYNALALAIHGHLRSYLAHDYDAALRYFDRALAASPNCSTAWCFSAATLAYVGRGEQSLRHLEQGLRLSPFEPGMYYWYNVRAWAYYSLAAYENALTWTQMSAHENPRFTANLRLMAATLVALGRNEEAGEVGSRMLSLEPNFRWNEYLETRQPFSEAVIRQRYISHLAMLGLPS